MWFYEVLVSSQQFHGEGPLTYSCDQNLKKGQVITVPLRKQKNLAIVTAKVKEPVFATKEIIGVLETPPIPLELITLYQWMQYYYPAPAGQQTGLFLPASLIQKQRRPKQRVTPKNSTAPPTMNKEQLQIVQNILRSHEKMHLLHGETGSGKTRVYIELIGASLKNGRSTIILTPEIGLTSQLTTTIESVFPGKTIVLHSNLTPAQRRDAWYQINGSLEPVIVIGARSALFSPTHNVGIIILDEAHDTAYKQEQAPYYVASRVAAKLGELHDAKVILGTATPLVSDYFTFKQKKLPIHRMIRTAIPSTHTSRTEIINLRDTAKFSQSTWMSDSMITSIQKNIAQNLQSLVFLNRRGSARMIVCQSCGWHATCPNCDTTLTYHADSHNIRCHLCAYSMQTPSACPDCKETDILFKNIGTKAVVTELYRLFPKATITRLDSDNTKEERLENKFETIVSGKTDIIVGTQIIAKGLDLPKLGLVAVLLADTGLAFPDYTAEERTFQLISQVIGRANRGHQDTDIIVQTFSPDNSTIKQAIAKDYDGFYANQIIERKRFGFPPFSYVLKLRLERTSSKAAEKAAQDLVDSLREQTKGLSISNPAPAFIEKVQNKYRWHILVRSSNRSNLLKIVSLLPSNVYHDIDPSSLL